MAREFCLSNLIKFTMHKWLQQMVPGYRIIKETHILDDQIWDIFWRCDFCWDKMTGCVVFNQDGLYMFSIPLADGTSSIVCRDAFTIE